MEYLSLYDYLGKAAGEKLGGEVKAEADKRDVPFKIRLDFLEFYFREPHSIHMDDLPKGHDWTGNVEDDDLPF